MAQLTGDVSFPVFTIVISCLNKSCSNEKVWIIDKVVGYEPIFFISYRMVRDELFLSINFHTASRAGPWLGNPYFLTPSSPKLGIHRCVFPFLPSIRLNVPRIGILLRTNPTMRPPDRSTERDELFTLRLYMLLIYS